MMAVKNRKRTSRTTIVPEQAPLEETKRQKFERLVTARMNRVLNSIRLLGNLASPNYEWRGEDIERVRETITDVLTTSLGRFRKHKKGEKLEFHLSPKDKENA